MAGKPAPEQRMGQEGLEASEGSWEDPESQGSGVTTKSLAPAPSPDFFQGDFSIPTISPTITSGDWRGTKACDLLSGQLFSNVKPTDGESLGE